jgi:hypothetical protein
VAVKARVLDRNHRLLQVFGKVSQRLFIPVFDENPADELRVSVKNLAARLHFPQAAVVQRGRFARPVQILPTADPEPQKAKGASADRKHLERAA